MIKYIATYLRNNIFRNEWRAKNFLVFCKLKLLLKFDLGKNHQKRRIFLLNFLARGAGGLVEPPELTRASTPLNRKTGTWRASVYENVERRE